MAKQSYSIVEYYAEQERYSCGYCKSPNTNFSHGMGTHILTVQDYQSLIDRGWRRCGSYCYKPTMDQTCCPMYTIKCEALQFKISKSQKKVLKRMAKFLRNELQKDDSMDIGEDDHCDNIDIAEIPNQSKHFLKAQENVSDMNVKFVNDEVNMRLHPDVSSKENKANDLKVPQKSSENIPVASSHNNETDSTSHNSQSAKTATRPPCMKAKMLRKQRKQNKLLAQGKSPEEVEAIFNANKQDNNAKSLEKLFDEVCNGTSRLELKLVRVSPMSSGYIETSKQSYEVYRKYQTMIHGVVPEKVTEKQYIRFLVKSPLQPWTPEDGPPSGYGSFHEQYWLDNELIAVGVIDILPSCISSVYFFYDPAYSYLSLGTFSSLREVYLTRELNKVAPALKYYYMGFYIHTCPKMRYKARMRPSKLLCPETYGWFDIEPCLLKLDKQKYSRLNDDIDAIDEDGVIDIRKVLVLYREVAMPYEIYKRQSHHSVSPEEENEIKEYASLVGMKCAQRLLLYRC
ncbi:arginyltransferase 1 isoform X3 [Megachile rotundata]|uniref:arginyltransferase 1 isoform X3 n=1 Tax=Megachile rotundata TaxID=143995 RepID=UPI000614AB9E|nr:PREDICTED: arginyl-tRNA--protein transferase 1 isoform X2 [Megachile rotundata]